MRFLQVGPVSEFSGEASWPGVQSTAQAENCARDHKGWLETGSPQESLGQSPSVHQLYDPGVNPIFLTIVILEL